MNARALAPLFFLAVLTVSEPTQAQDEGKSPRPLPPTPADKVSIDTSTTDRPIATPRSARRSMHPSPSGAPDVSGLSFQIDRVLLSEPGDGRIWARGSNYKASFGAEGASFIPFFGSDAPENYAVRFTVASVVVDGDELELDMSAVVRRERERVVLDRGDVDEVYDVALGHIEQTIVVERMSARGALSVEIAVDSRLEARQLADGIEFSNERGSVHYGNASVFDANGARVQAASQLVDGRIRIEVPADFVHSARLPLRIDPLIATVTVASSAANEFRPDIAFDATTAQWCVVYEYEYSMSDHDVATLLLDYFGVVVPGQTAWVDLTADFWSNARVANNNIANNFMVAADVAPATGGNRSIKVVTRDAASTAVGAQVQVSGTETGDKHDPDIGGDPSLSPPTYYYVVWQRDYSSSDSDVHGRLVSSSAVPQGAGVTYIDNSGGTIELDPRISNSDGSPPSPLQDWNIVWSRYSTVLSDHDIRAAQVRWDGGITSPSFLLDGTVGTNGDDLHPTASPPLDWSTGLRPWMVVSDRVNGPPTTLDVMGRILEGTTVLWQESLTDIDGVNVLDYQYRPDVDTDGSLFTVSFHEAPPALPLSFSLHTSSYCYVSGQVLATDPHVLIGHTDQRATLFAVHSSGVASRRVGAAWSDFETTNYNCFAGMVDAPQDVPTDVICSGDGSLFTCPCNNNGAANRGCGHSGDALGASLTASGSRHASNDTAVLTAQHLPAGAPALFFQGSIQSSTPFGDGRLCVGGTIVRLGVVFSSAGTASYPNAGAGAISTQGSIGVNGANRFYQAWYRDAAPFCTASTFNLTNALRMIWLP